MGKKCEYSIILFHASVNKFIIINLNMNKHSKWYRNQKKKLL